MIQIRHAMDRGHKIGWMPRRLLTLVALLFLSGCTGLPKGVEPVRNFHLERYLGTWYEVARLDHSFERGLEQVTATYEMRADGGVRVLNRGYSAEDRKWKTAEGKAYFARQPDEGYLKVSFFEPFYGSYAVFELDQENYQYAFVAGPSTSYLWLLSRSPAVSDAVRERFIRRAHELGFATDKLIFVKHP